MTTVLWTGDAIYADSQVTSSSDCVVARVDKVRYLSDGSVWTFAGDSVQGHLMGEYLTRKDLKLPKGGGIDGLIVISGRAFKVTSDGIMLPIKPPFALGSGGNFALVAYRCGKSGREAVEVACEFDVWSSGPVQEVLLPSMVYEGTVDPCQV